MEGLATRTQISSFMPSTFSCNLDDLRQLSKRLEVYQVIRDVRNQVSVVVDQEVTGDEEHGIRHYRCAWINNHILDNCIGNVPQDPQLIASLDNIFRCSQIYPKGSYTLCSNV